MILSFHSYFYYLRQITGYHFFNFPIEIIGLIMEKFCHINRIRVKCGHNHTCVLIDGYVHSFGVNMSGQLGVGSKFRTCLPRIVNLPKVKKITCGPNTALALTTTGNIYAWGDIDKDISGRLNDISDEVYAPLKLDIPNVKKIKHNIQNFIIITFDDEIHTFFYGPIKHKIPNIKKIKYNSHIMILNKLGEIYSYGQNTWGQLGLGHNKDFHIVPNNTFEKVNVGSNCIDMNCGFAHTIVLTVDKKLYVWGKNDYGQLGLGDTKHRNTPHELVLEELRVSKINVVGLNCGMDQTFILLNNCQIYVCGYNYESSLGTAPYNIVCVPVKLSFDVIINHVSSGENHTFFRSINNELYVCGSNKNGQLGFDTLCEYKVPIKFNSSCLEKRYFHFSVDIC